MGLFGLFGKSAKIKNACMQSMSERRLIEPTIDISALRRVLRLSCNLHKNEYQNEIKKCFELSRKVLFFATEGVVNGAILILEGTLDLPDKIYLDKKSEVATTILSDSRLYSAVCASVSQSFEAYMQLLSEYELHPLRHEFIHNILSDMIKE